MSANPVKIRKRPVIATMRAISALILREMATTYGKSAFGYLWVILEPLLGIALLSVVFSLAFRHPSLGTNFPIFYASGFLPYILYMNVSKKVATAINFSRPLLTYPSVTFLDAIIGRLILNWITQVVVFYLLVTGIEILFDTYTIRDYKSIGGSLLMAGALGLGIGTLNCYLWSVAPSWERVWGILNKPLFILSAILYTFEELPPLYQKYLWYNPLVHITALSRRGFYPNYDGAFVSPAYVYGIAGVCMVAGLFLLVHYHRRILN